MRRQQQGVALITAVLIVALVTAVAVSMAARQQVDIRRASNLFSNDQAYLFALGAEDYARNVLEWDITQAKNPDKIDHLGEDWAQTVSVPVEGAMLSGTVHDMQGRINLNALVDVNGQTPNQTLVARFEQLLRLLELDENIAPAVVDWIDTDNNPQPSFGGAEEAFYMLQEPPYRAANAPMASASELRLVRGVDDAAYEKLIPFVTALPAHDTKVNVNTAPAEVLTALVGSVSPADGESIIEKRDGEEFASIPDFTTRTGFQIDQNIADVNSHYFRVDAVAEFDQTVARLHSVLERNNESGEVRVVMRSRGAF